MTDFVIILPIIITQLPLAGCSVQWLKWTGIPHADWPHRCLYQEGERGRMWPADRWCQVAHHGCCCPSDGGQQWGRYWLCPVVAQLQGLPNQLILSMCCELFFALWIVFCSKLTTSPWKGQLLSATNSNWRAHCRWCCNAALFTLTRSPPVSNVRSKGRTN